MRWDVITVWDMVKILCGKYSSASVKQVHLCYEKWPDCLIYVSRNQFLVRE